MAEAQKGAPKKNFLENEEDFTEVIDMLEPSHDIDLKIKKIVDDLPESFSVVLLMPSEQHELKYLRLMKYFIGKGYSGVYVTLNNTVSELLREMSRQKINSEHLVFVDAVTKMGQGKEPAGEKFVFVESPGDLPELTVEIERALDGLGKEKGFLVLDSVTTLLIYNKDVSIEKFLHSISKKIKDMGYCGFFLASETTNKEIIDTIAQFCDDVKSI